MPSADRLAKGEPLQRLFQDGKECECWFLSVHCVFHPECVENVFRRRRVDAEHDEGMRGGSSG